MPRQFYIALNGSSGPLTVNVRGGTDYPGAQDIILYQIDADKLNYNAIWEFTPEGLLVCASDPNLALEVGGTSVTLQTRNPALPAQRWRISPTNPLPNQSCTIQSKHSATPYYLSSEGSNSDDEIVVSSTATEWKLQPAILDAAIMTLETALSTSEGLQDDTIDVVVSVLAVSGTTASANASLQVEPQQPGSLTQAWIFNWDQRILSAQNPGLGITITGTSGDDYVAALTSNPDQWSVNIDGEIYTEYSGNKVYLNVQGGSLSNGKGSVIGFSLSTTVTKNQIWLPRSIQPDVQGLYFVIGSAWEAPSGQRTVPYILTPGANQQLYAAPPLAGGVPVLSQLWRMTTGGRVINALSPQLVLTVNATGTTPVLSVQQIDDSTPDLYQSWTWYGGREVSDPKNSKNKLTVAALVSLGPPNYVIVTDSQPGAYASGVVSVGVEPTKGSLDPSSDSQLWYVAPHLPSFNKGTNIRSGLSDGNAEWFLSIPSTNLVSNNAATLVEGDAKGPGAGWQFTIDGQIVSTLNPAMALSVGTDKNDKPYVCVYPIQPGSPLFQLWVPTLDGLIISRLNGHAITASAAPSGVSLKPPPTDGTVPPDQRWHCATGLELQTVLAQPRLPWPTAEKGSHAAAIYEYINSQLGLPTRANGQQIDAGLRAQYLNLAAPLQSYQLALNLMKCPASLDQGIWPTVVTQLNIEITAVMAVQALFQQLQTLHLAMMDAQIPTLSGLANAVSLTETSSLKMPTKKGRSWIWTLCDSFTYAVIELAGTVIADPELGGQATEAKRIIGNVALPAIANFGMSASSSAQDAFQSGGSPGPALNAAIKMIEQNKLTVLNLQEALVETFQEVGVALGAMETAILGDWAKVRAVYEMTKVYGEPASLFWPGTTTPALMKAMLPGYQLSVLQTLIVSGSNFSIDRYSGQWPRSGNSGLQPDGLSYVDFEVDGSMSTYELNYGNDKQQYASDLMTYLWSLGAVPFQFFHRQGGWSAMSMTQVDDATTPARPYMLFAFRNGLPQEVAIDVPSLSHPPAGGINPVPVPAFGETIFCVSDNDSGPSNFVVNLSVNSTQIASFKMVISNSNVWSCPSSDITVAPTYILQMDMNGVMDDVNEMILAIYQPT